MARITEVVVERRQLTIAALRTCNLPALEALAEGQVLLATGEFALITNNVTYAALDGALCYWEFFPADEELDIVPVWGFAEVLASRYPGVEPGERFYGYYPMASHLLVAPTQVRDSDFIDTSKRRRNLLPVYNQHLRRGNDPLCRASDETLQMLLRPLFTASFLLDGFLAEHAFFGAANLLLSSTSSKTAIGLAFLLQCSRAQYGQDYHIVDLTSAGNRAFVEGLGCYNEVLAYNRLDALGAGGDALSVDFAGSGTLLGQLHQRLDGRLHCNCLVDAIRWDQRGGLPRVLPGPTPKLFFTLTQAKKRLKDRGGAAFQARLAEVWDEFLTFVGDWIQVRRGVGDSKVLEVYQDLLTGRSTPQPGCILSLDGGWGRRFILLDGGGEPVADDEAGSTHGVGGALAPSLRRGMERYRSRIGPSSTFATSHYYWYRPPPMRQLPTTSTVCRRTRPGC